MICQEVVRISMVDKRISNTLRQLISPCEMHLSSEMQEPINH
jgi:hypothetical protein